MIDLHIHTTYSDGNKTPNEIIEMAIEKNIDTISFCDHNSIKAYDAVSTSKNIKIINGIEFYALKENVSGTFHMLAYDYLINNEFNELMSYFEEKRKESMEVKLKKIYTKFGINIDIDDLNQDWLCNKSLSEFLLQLYDKEKVKEIVDYVRSLKIKTDRKIDYKNLIEIIRNANGIPVLAHPKSIVCDNFDDFIKDLVKCGIMGIEVYHSSHDFKDINKFLENSKKYNMLVSGGSDYHGYHHKNSLGEDVLLGNCNFDKGIDDVSILRYIRSRK